MPISTVTNPAIVNLQLPKREVEIGDETFSSPISNYIEKNTISINGISKDYTTFYTQVDTNLRVNDFVYIVNGNYDTVDLIEEYQYQKGTTGYKVLEIDKTKITLEIEYQEGKLPFIENENSIEIITANGQQARDYEILSNGLYPFKYMLDTTANGINTAKVRNNKILFFINQLYICPFNTTDTSDFNNWINITNDFINNYQTTQYKTYFDEVSSGKLTFREDTIISGIQFKKGLIYENINNTWTVDKKSQQAFISKGSLQKGKFIADTWNDGIYGNIETNVEWDSSINNSKWLNGILFNAKWLNGTLESKSDSIPRQNYYSYTENNEIKVLTDFNNNNQGGYNFIYQTDFDGDIKNGNFNNSIIGSYPNNATSVHYRYVNSITQVINTKIENGNYINSTIVGSELGNATFKFSEIINCLSIDTTPRILDSNVSDSVVSGEYNNIGIKVVDSERIITTRDFLYENENTVFADSTANSNKLIQQYKFYINESDFNSFTQKDAISLHNLIPNKVDFLSIFDEKFYAISNGIDFKDSDNFKFSVFFRTKNDNKDVRKVTNDFNVLNTTTPKRNLPSIDIIFEFDLTSPATTVNETLQAFNTTPTSYNSDFNLGFSSISDSFITNSDLICSKLINGTLKGNVINDSEFIIKRTGAQQQRLDITVNAGQITINYESSPNFDINFNKIVYLDNIIAYTGTITSLTGAWNIVNFDNVNSTVTLSPTFVITLSPLSIFTTPSSEQDLYNSIHFINIDNTNIIEGKLRRNSITNSVFNNNDINIKDTETTNNLFEVNKLKVINFIANEPDNNTIANSTFIDSIFIDETIENGYIFRSILDTVIINNGILDIVLVRDSIMNNGIIKNSKNFNIPFTNVSVTSKWDNGIVNDGTIKNSLFLSGTFNDGEIYNSIFANGTMNGGKFGKVGLLNSQSLFGSSEFTTVAPIWNNGIFINGEFGINETPLNLPTIIGDFNWNNGTFANGIMHSYTEDMMVIFNDGKFNNGEIVGYVKWKNGTMNGGLFSAKPTNPYPILINECAWEDGTFNGGKFGSETGKISAILNGTEESYPNPSWFKGTVNGGEVRAKIWNDGIVTGGRIFGNPNSFENNYEKTINFQSTYIENTRKYYESNLGLFYSNITVNSPSSDPTEINFTNDTSFTTESSNSALIDYLGGNSIEISSNLNGGVVISDILYAPILDYSITKIIMPYITEIYDISPVDYLGTTPEFDFTVEIEIYDTNTNSWVIPIGSTSQSFTKQVIDTGTTPTQLHFSDIIDYVVNIPKNTRWRIIYEIAARNIFNPKAKIDTDLFKIYSDVKTQNAKISDQFVMNFSDLNTDDDWYGLWRNGQVINDDASSQDNILATKRTDISRRLRQFKNISKVDSKLENILWVDGTFNSNGTMENSVFLRGKFIRGNFDKSSINPFVPKWGANDTFDILGGDVNGANAGRYKHELDNTKILWSGGKFKESCMYLTNWKQGTFISGDAYSVKFDGGLLNYINAHNCINNGARMIRGNWFGANIPINSLRNTLTRASNDITQIFDYQINSGNKYKDMLFYNMQSLSTKLFGNDLVTKSVNLQLSGTNNPIYTPNGDDGTYSNLNLEYLTPINEPTTYTIGDYLFQPIDTVLNDLNYFNDGNGYTESWRYEFPTVTVLVNDVLDIVLQTEGVSPKIGNGAWLKGVGNLIAFNNGVWDKDPLETNNNIDKYDTIFRDIDNFFEVSNDIWQLEISGDFTEDNNRINNFNVGDFISIGNIVTKNINGDRKVIRDSYKIIDIDYINIKMTVQVKATFPIRSIEVDSENHRLYISLRAWENGVFHVGKFEGVFNNGIIKGHPLNTRFENSHIIASERIEGVTIKSELINDPLGDYNSSLIQTSNNIQISGAKIGGTTSFNETVLDLVYQNNMSSDFYSFGTALALPNDLELRQTTNDILSANISTPIEYGTYITKTLKFGTKYKEFEDLINDNLVYDYNLSADNQLEERGWRFAERLPSAIGAYGETALPYNPSSPANQQSFFVLTTGNDIFIDLAGEVNYHNIKHENLKNVISERYYRLVYNIKDVSGVNVIKPFDKDFLSSFDSNSMGVGKLVEAFYQNPINNMSIISNSQNMNNIDNVKFVEVDAVPYPRAVSILAKPSINPTITTTYILNNLDLLEENLIK